MVLFVSCCPKQVRVTRTFTILTKALSIYIPLNGPICVMLPKASKDDKNIYNYNNFANVYTT